LNTHAVYNFALVINPLTKLEYKAGATLKDVFFSLVSADYSLRNQLEQQYGFFLRLSSDPPGH
jgi:hypothetical protein